jgi:hypothetical protein
MFARPDTGGTPTSYPVPTWSACKGVFESIAMLVEGYPRPYVRDGVPGLSMEKQEEMLEALGLDLSDQKAYRDNLSRPKIRKRAPLVERDLAIVPRLPGETIYVASLRVLGWDSHEVIRVMAIAAAKAAKIHCVDTSETYSAETPAPEILSALTRAEQARRRARMAPAGNSAQAAQKRRVEKGLAIAKEHWGRPPGEISVAEIAKLAGLSTRTLYHHMPSRTQTQEEALHGKRHA